MATRYNREQYRKNLFLNDDIDELLAKQRCIKSEKKIEKALERLKRKGLIIDYINTSEIKKIDEQRVDFIVIITERAHYKVVPLQIKSSWVGAMKHNIAMAQIRKGIENMFRKVPVIIVNQRDSIEDLCKKILNAIS